MGVFGTAVPAAAAAPGRCVTSKEQIGSSVGLWTGSTEPDPSDFAVPSVDRLATGLGDLRPTVVVRRRHGRIGRVELCDERRRLAVLPRPGPRDVIEDVSVDGTAIAWRTRRPDGRGRVLVGRVRRGRVVAVRSTGTPRYAASQASVGTLVVLPDGESAWSLPVGRGAAVWLWPRGHAVRRIATTGRPGRTQTAWDVRIVDARHVLLGRHGRIARYGPATPGRCPTPFLATTRVLDTATVSALTWSHFPISDFDDDYDSISLVCDATLGDYTATEVTASTAGLHNSTGTGPVHVYRTAGVTVLLEHSGSYPSTGIGSYTGVVVRPGAPQPTQFAPGYVAGPGLQQPFTTPDAVPPYPPPALVQLGPGAAAWLALDARDASDEPSTVWVADADGARAIGRVRISDGYAPGFALVLTDHDVTWTGAPTGPIPIRPAADDPLRDAPLTVPAAG